MMRGKRALCAPLCVAAALFFLSQTARAGHIFFSTSNTLNGTVAVSNPNIVLPAPGTGTLYFWITDTTPVTPPPIPGGSVAAMAFQVNRSGSSATMTSSEVYNFNLRSTIAATGADVGPTPQDRWTLVTINHPDNEAIVIATVTQAGAGSPGLNPLNDGLHLNPGSAVNGTLDPGYDKVSHAFLYGQLNYSAGVGTTTFNLAKSPLQIVVGGTDITDQFTYGFATVTVVPEPASCALALCGILFGVAARIRRRS